MAASRWLLFFGVWSVPALLASLSGHLGSADVPDRSFVDAALAEGLWWQFFTPLTPALLRRGGRLASATRGTLALIAGHGAAALALAVTHAAALAALYPLILGAGYAGTSFGTRATSLLAAHLLGDVLAYAGVLAVGVAIALRQRVRSASADMEKLESKLSKAQLKALKMQLHPHFLFNSLHALGVLVRKQDTKGALRMLIGLSDLLRVTIDSAGKQVVSLRQELDFLHRYLRVERIRFGDRLDIDMQVEDDVLGARVPHLVLQPLLENAIRHGIVPRDDAGHIVVKAQRIVGQSGDRPERPRLRIEVLDDGVGLAEDSAEVSGMGLANVRARLDQMYGDECVFEICDRQDAVGVAAVIEIPLWLSDERTSGPVRRDDRSRRFDRRERS